MIEQVKNDPAMPCHWGANQPGMQARAELEEKSLSYAKEYWLMAAKSAAMVAENMAEIGLHKQVANRILEPFQWMHTIVTATEWDNFFKLRAHPDADPNIYALAHEMGNAREASRPVEREFHAPYLLHDDVTIEKEMAMVSAARCARVSYLNHDGTSPSASKDLDLANKLRESGHWSPFEHVAFATPTATVRAANFKGWKSYRNQLGF
jgi:thymidylate synthase ThyX